MKCSLIEIWDENKGDDVIKMEWAHTTFCYEMCNIQFAYYDFDYLFQR